MKRFRFSLETLLAIRWEKEQESEIALAAASGQLQAIDQSISEARRAGDEAFKSPAADLDAMAARDRLWAKSVNRCAALAAPRAEAARRVDKARSVYTEAHIERTALERLREKRFEQWRGDMKRKEAALLDENARGILLRRRRSEGMQE